MKNILIPTDFSDNAWNAIAYAVKFFAKSSCRFYLLHVNTPNKNRVALIDKNASIKLNKTLNKIKTDLPKSNRHRFFTILDNNYLIKSIRDQVEEKQIDFIVMGTKGASDIKQIPLGSNTGNVITKVPCSTLVVPENAKYSELKEIAFPTDFLTLYTPNTLSNIANIVAENKASVRVLHIKNSKAVLNEEQQENKAFLDDYLGYNEHSFHFLTNTQIENQVQRFVENKHVNLITMLAKNLNYFQKILFHPTIPEIKYYTDIPFLVLH
ncbi:universal stress protein [Algibacter sp. PT7-4]|uniref:universal stress protein n=1 Tax=Algibacter ulvanivorans TaxID=3400999 RepID=UPI003AAD5888